MAINKKHIEKVFSSKFSLRDQKMLESYFEDKEQNQETKEVIQKQWENFDEQDAPRARFDDVFYRLFYTINTQEENRKVGFRPWKAIYQAAAILVVGILISASIYFTNKNVPYLSGEKVEFFSHTGFRNQFKLPDGTTGWLGYGSKLTYKVADDHTRTVLLDGIAYFDVFHNAEQPFVVKTPSQLDVKVLGTRFNVASYAADNTCEVVLEKGKVSLNFNGEQVEELTPNERVLFHADNKTIEKSTVNVNDFLAWKEGRLVLNNVTLEECCVKLSRFYNVDIKLEDKDLGKQEVRLVLEDETLEEALGLLSMIFKVDCKIKERSVQKDNSYTKKNIIISKKQRL